MGYARDIKSGAIVNVDDSQYKAVIAARESKRLNKQLEKELSVLKDEFKAIRDQFYTFMESHK